METVGRSMMNRNILNARFAIEIKADIAMLLSVIKKRKRQNRFQKKKPIYMNEHMKSVFKGRKGGIPWIET